MNYITDLVVTQESIYKSLGSSVKLVCPIITTRGITWLGPPNLEIYAVGTDVLPKFSTQVDVSETDADEKSTLLIRHFTKDKSGKFICLDTYRDKREFNLIIKSKIKTESQVSFMYSLIYFIA